MKNILLALLLVLPFSIAATEIGGAKSQSGPYMIYCNSCPEKSIQEKFVDDLRVEDAGVVVHWDAEGMPERISILSTTVAPIQDVCQTFLKYWPNRATTITVHVGYLKQYRCDGSLVGGPASLEVASE